MNATHLAISRMPLLLALAAGIAPSALCVGAEVAAAGPSFADLLNWNAETIFGGKLTLEKDDRFTLAFPGEGLFEKGFRCQGKAGQGVISDAAAVKDVSVKRTLLEGAAGTFSLVGLSSGSAVSRFPLGNDYSISFKVRIPILMAASKLVFILNQEGRSYIQLSFFQEASVISGGRRRAAAASRDPRFRGPPAQWFDRKSAGVPVEIVFKEGKLTVRMHAPAQGNLKEGMADVVTLDGVSEPTEGNLALSFDRISFLISDLKIAGKLPADRLKQEIESLRGTGQLRTRAPEPPAAGKETKDTPDAAKKGDSKAKPKKDTKKGPDLEQPDPEADDIL
ncbi:MAG: hypothetical protein JXA90_01280 [Planctomycetes bacterium]|nr:hypothetical protein [Planctomycetota bacterium]